MKVKANVILAKCTEGQLYGMRVEKQDDDWVRTWAFPIKEDIAAQEGFDKIQLKGSFYKLEEYPGCPYCGGSSFFVCGTCKKINCYHGGETTTCMWCKNSARTYAGNEFDLTGGGY